MRLKTILLAIAVVAVSFFVSLKAMDWFSPRGAGSRPALADLPPLPPAPRSSVIMAQVAIPITAIRDAADRGTPRNFSGKADNPVSQVLQNADIGWTASRGPIRRHRRPGRAVADHGAERQTERHGLAGGQGHRRGR